jgi:drug/metabolite transporter (DMT)-like permease
VIPSARSSASRVPFSGLDLLLLLMVVIWGANFSVIKYALRDFPPVVFNAWRLAIVAVLFLAAIAFEQRWEGRLAHFTRAEWARVAALGVLGHTVYQLCFVGGLALTGATNSALIFGCTPIAVALIATLAGHERVTWPRWAGAGLSIVGLYFVVGRGARLGVNSLAGDALVFAAMICWALYSVGSQPLLRRVSPLVLTGYSTAIGATVYCLMALPAFLATKWAAISTTSWALMFFSSVFALGVAYLIWYTAVQRIGSTRTSIYSNLTPVVAMVVAYFWLAEPIALTQTLGAAAILGGIFVTRLARS